MVNRADISSVLSDIRALRSQMQLNQKTEVIQRPDLLKETSRVAETKDTPSFQSMFSKAIDGVNDLQMQSGRLQEAYERGDPEVDITRVMVAGQKAGVAFQGLLQVRNRVVRAYEDIMNMPI